MGGLEKSESRKGMKQQADIHHRRCEAQIDHNLQIDSRNVDIYTIPWSCYNRCQQHEFVRFLFYVLVKISVAKNRPKNFNALCAP